ncbi:MAG: DUF924 domain-containing protein [Proteobacteria bacterium]|nr:DUF924 domain-containing protein [Pseudomonadota bacterium]
MTVRPVSETTATAIADDDQTRIDAILSFWFKEHELSAPQIDRRMDIWFGEDPIFDHEIEKDFSADVDKASDGELDHWAHDPRGRLALIILLDQFRRSIYRNTPSAFEKDPAALKLCVEGAMEGEDKGLSPIQRVFFYMPLQHAESRKVQAKSVELFARLAEAVSPTLRETFMTVAQFAELHRDIVERFGRFPHRNKMLNRKNTAEENEYLGDDET